MASLNERLSCFLWLVAGCLLLGVSSPVWASPHILATDYTSHKITLNHPARRIVALTPHLVEDLFTVGLGGRVVGAVRGSNYPAAAKTIPRVGGYGSLSLEAIVALHPDLVVAWAEGGAEDIVARLRGLGIPVYVDNPHRFPDIARTLRDLGALGGTEPRARRAAADFTKRIATLRSRYADRRAVSLFYEIWPDPLQTVSGEGFMGAAIRLCGGRNIFADAPASAPRVSIESVIAHNPQAIVMPSKNLAVWSKDWQKWSSIKAVEHHHFVGVNPDLISRPTVRIATGAAELCRGLAKVRISPRP